MANTNKRIEYKGYVIIQSSYNHHITILHNGKVFTHTQCDKPKTDDELRDLVDTNISLMREPFGAAPND